ncbi:MAG: surface carbohydrate biosynthesis protein [Alkaliphilus sp.]
MDFIIIYERKIRELENAIMLKIELEKRGYKCVVFQFLEGAEFNLFNINSPKIILVPHLYGGKSIPRIFSRFGKANHLVNLQYEQVLSKTWEELGFHNPKGEAKQAIHICWGVRTYNRLKDAGVSIRNLKVLGAIQLDLLRKEYRHNTLGAKQLLSAEFGLDATKRWTLFISSFTFADIAEERLKMNESVAGKSLEDYVEIHTTSRDCTIEWLVKILEKDKENTIIYRPHPEELSINKIIRLEKKYANFKVIAEHSVKIWIESSDNIYSWYSTSVFESHFLEKPYSIIRPIELSDDFDSVLLKHATFITKYSDFEKDYLKDDNERELPIDNSYIREYYQVDEVNPAYKNYCDMLEKLFNSNSKQHFNIKFKDTVRSKFKAIAVVIVNILYKTLKFDLEKYRIRNNNNFFIRWFIEMDNQIATGNEKRDIEERLKKTMFINSRTN